MADIEKSSQMNASQGPMRSRTVSYLNDTSAESRSRSWSDDIQALWSKPVAESETAEDRLERYRGYFTLSKEQLEAMYKAMVSELELGLKNHLVSREISEGGGGGEIAMRTSSLAMLDTFISQIPSGQEKGVSYSLDCGGTNVRAVRTKLEGNGKVSLIEEKINLRDIWNIENLPQSPLGLLAPNVGAIHLFNTLANTIKTILAKTSETNPANVGFTFSFPCVMNGIKCAKLLRWTKGFQTGEETDDPVVDMDIAALLDVAFWRNNINAKTVAVVNDTAGSLLACAYQKSAKLPQCLVGMILGTGLNGAYVEPHAKEYGYAGSIINTELGNFDQSLPITDVDMETDFAEIGSRGAQYFEKLVSGGYLGEICRRLILKVYQSSAPALAWIRQSLPAHVASLIVQDGTEGLELTGKVLNTLWDWKINLKIRTQVQQLCQLVFYRSATLAAVAVAALCKKTERLQPAMGGVTVAIEGSLFSGNPFYPQKLREGLNLLLGPSAAGHVHIVETFDGSSVGAAILAGIIS